MTTSLKYASEKKGLGPGSLIHVGSVHQADSHITLVDYDHANYEKRLVSSLEEVLPYRDKQSLTWVIVEGLADASIVESIGQHFNIHPLVLEDILNTHQRPKFEEHDDYLFVVLKCLLPEEGEFSIVKEQVSLVIFKDIVFTFKEKADSLLDPVMKRLENGRGRIRRMGTDYLMYAVLDAIIDLNFDIMDQLEETLITVEDEIFTLPTPELLEKIHGIKLEVIRMRRFISPVRDLTAGLLRSESELIDPNTRIYLRDVHDHVLRIIESIETHRDILSSLLEIYLSSISSRLNEVMKVLTVFSSIFIPLTFITGIYGMNFEWMPELSWHWAYPAVWLVFITTSCTLFLYFKRRGWT
ncbi:Cobalt/magnesium transport protein CorA [Halioglobus japonicus]|nr:Cobalt/magnesium transport protein CorA [Halioglobus japonicus]